MSICAKSPFIRNYYFFICLLITLLAKLAIVIPTFPRGGLDPSWGYGLAAAAEQHLVFGRDIIYTFGPLSFVSTGVWTTPNGHLLTALLSVFIAFSLSFFCYKVFEQARYIVRFLLVIFFFVNIVRGIDFYYSLLTPLAALTLINSSKNTRSYSFTVILFGFIVALLLLIKISFGIEGLACFIVMLTFYAIKKDKKSSLTLIVAFFVSFGLLYIVSGQGLENIFYYILNIYYGVTGYNDALSRPGPIQPVIASALFLVVFISYCTYQNIKPFNLRGIFCVLIISLLSFIIFKHSYVRNDPGHSIDIYQLQCFLLIYILHILDKKSGEKSVIKNVLITICVFSLLFFGYYNYQFFFNSAQIKSSYATLVLKAKNTDRIFKETRNEIAFINATKSISNSSPLPTLNGTSDIYNYNQAVLLASDNVWNPRPAFQSFQAVSPYTISKNYEHLLNKKTAPDNVFFRVETIDGRIPALDDGLSWKALLGLYKPDGWTEKHDYLLLKRDISSDKDLSVEDAKNIEGKMGEEITNPYPNGLVFIKLNIRKSLPGVIWSVIYKTDPVWMKLQLQDGQEKKYRIIPSMSETGFLLSPLTLSTSDFSRLYKAAYFPGRDIGTRVRSITVLPESPYQYSDFIGVTFEQLEPPDRSKDTVLKLKRTSVDLCVERSDPSTIFNVDSLIYKLTDGMLALSFHGWALRANTDIKNSSYSLVLAGENGDCMELPLSNVKRDDVTKHFNDGHNYNLSGYTTADGLFDAAELKGKTTYKLYLRMIINGTAQTVPLGKTIRGS